MDNGISLIYCFEQQLSEIEMLASMYPSSDEFTVSLPHIPADMNKFISGETRYVPSQLDFVLNLTLPDIKEKLEINVCFPHEYPFSKPEVSTRSVSLNRVQQKNLNSTMRGYLQSLPSGEMCILSLIDWLMENASEFFTSSQSEEQVIKDETSNLDTLCRMWIYSHHIYNKFKRREIVDLGGNLNLTGFSLPGKPGFICIEGFKTDCSKFMHHLKQMSWKKISLVKEETEDLSKTDLSEFRKFENFSEISFQVRRGPAKEYHMDMGQFLKYLGEHDCAYAFQDLFGFEGHVSSDK